MDREEEPEQNEDQEAGERRLQETLTGGIEIEYDEYDNNIDDVIEHCSSTSPATRCLFARFLSLKPYYCKGMLSHKAKHVLVKSVLSHALRHCKEPCPPAGDVAIYSYYPSYFVNPNPGEAQKLPKNRFEQKWVKKRSSNPALQDTPRTKWL
jgi:hypothetical protein